MFSDPALTNIPVDVTIDLTLGQTIPTEPTNVSGTDNCDTDVEIAFVETEVEEGCGSTITRTWTATDNCGTPVHHHQ